MKNHTQDQKKRSLQAIKEQWIAYKPLIVIFIFSLILPFFQKYIGTHTSGSLMYGFMGYFFVFLSLFKFFDLEGFVDGFATYDLIAKKIRGYGYAYPYIELFLGIGYLTGFHLGFINVVTLIVMTISGLGVLERVTSGQKIKCACLGTTLNVPLGVVSIVENFGMGIMAAIKLIFP